MIIKHIRILIVLLVLTPWSFAPASAQVHDPVRWDFKVESVSGTEATLAFTAILDDGWHIYSQFMEDGGPLPTSFTFEPSEKYTLVGEVEEEGILERSYDEIFMMDILSFSGTPVFRQRIKLNAATAEIRGKVAFMVCTDEMCLPPAEQEFAIPVTITQAVPSPATTGKSKPVKATDKTESPSTSREPESSSSPMKGGSSPDNKDQNDSDIHQTPETLESAPEIDRNQQPIDQGASSGDPDINHRKKQDFSFETVRHEVKQEQAESGAVSLWAIFLAGLVGGCVAVFMPCIFPMLPFTVSYFAKRTSTHRVAVVRSLYYGLSIIILYVGLGLGITLWLGSDALNDISTSGIFNLLFFLMLMVFAIALLGGLDISLPTVWVNKADEQSERRGGVLGIFFMAATLALVSFSCTGPIIGTLLVEAAVSGNYLGPAVGMLGFGITLAFPFMLFSMFPSWLHALPKSGSWLNNVKVVLGFLELALALKFLSNVDLAYHWGWLDREVFLVLWIVIFGLLGLYLLGKIRLPYDAEVKEIAPVRLCFAIIALAFTLYMIPGLWGAPLKTIAAFLPPQQTQDFNLYDQSLGNRGLAVFVNEPNRKYADIFHAPYNLNAFFDYEEGLAYARKVNKPVMIDFTGHACVNCRKMETVTWSDPAVLDRLRNDYVLVQLYVDDKTPLPEPRVSEYSGKKLGTLGNLWSDLQASVFHTNAQPYYVLLDGNGNQLLPGKGADYNAASFRKFLDDGLRAFGKR